MEYSANIMNAIPVADGWAPMPSPMDKNPLLEILADENYVPLVDELDQVLVEFTAGEFVEGTDALFLPEPSRGGVFVRLQNGSTRLFVGTQTRLWMFDNSGYFWKDVSGPSAPYSCDVRWSFALYGTTLYCCNGADTEQMYDIGTDILFSDNTTAPIANDIAVVADFMMRALPDNSVQWSALDDPTSNAVGVRFSDVQPFGDGNGVLRIIPVSSGAVIIQRDKFEILNYPDPEYVFRRTSLTGYRGSYSPWSACIIGQDDFVVYCQDGFYRGLNFQPIGAERVDRLILENCDQTARENMISAADFRRKIVWFRTQKSDGSYFQLGYHWQLDRWCQCDADLADMFGLETIGLTIGALPSVFPTIGDLDSVTFGSSIFDGGSVEFGGITSEGFLCYLYGPPMRATIETNEVFINEPNRFFVNSGRLSSDAKNHLVTLLTGDFGGQSMRELPAVTPSLRTGRLPLRGDGLYHKGVVVIPEGEPWTIMDGLHLYGTGSGI